MFHNSESIKVGLITFPSSEYSSLYTTHLFLCSTDENGDEFCCLLTVSGHLCVCVFVSTSEPFGVVFDRAKGGAVAKTAVDHGVNGQEVCHGSGKETSI